MMSWPPWINNNPLMYVYYSVNIGASYIQRKVNNAQVYNTIKCLVVICPELIYANCIGYQYASELLSRRPYWYINVGTAWLRHTCRHTASRRHHTAVGVTCALLSPVNSLFHVRGQTTETAVLPFTGQSCGTVFQPISVC